MDDESEARVKGTVETTRNVETGHQYRLMQAGSECWELGIHCLFVLVLQPHTIFTTIYLY